MFHVKFGFDWPRDFREELLKSVDDDDDGGCTTNDGCLRLRRAKIMSKFVK